MNNPRTALTEPAPAAPSDAVVPNPDAAFRNRGVAAAIGGALAANFYNTADYNRDGYNSYDPFMRFQVCADSPESVLPLAHSMPSH